MKYNKLVRDNILEVIRYKGGNPLFHIASDEEYWLKLKEKLQEEVNEFLESEKVEEIADIMEVIEAILIYRRISSSQILKIKKKKFEERGSFNKKIVLEEC